MVPTNKPAETMTTIPAQNGETITIAATAALTETASVSQAMLIQAATTTTVTGSIR